MRSVLGKLTAIQQANKAQVLALKLRPDDVVIMGRDHNGHAQACDPRGLAMGVREARPQPLVNRAGTAGGPNS